MSTDAVDPPLLSATAMDEAIAKCAPPQLPCTAADPLTRLNVSALLANTVKNAIKLIFQCAHSKPFARSMYLLLIICRRTSRFAALTHVSAAETYDIIN